MRASTPRSESAALRFFPPDEDLTDELVLSGRLRGEVETLASELKHVARFLRARVDPPTRVLFSGPSGTGKTLAARWLGWRLKIVVAIIDVAAVVGSHLGETAGLLRSCFAEADAARAILFLDEIDAICMRRDHARDGADAELARATTTFFQQVDWLPPERIVIAATNFPKDLDPALRRRLATEIAFEIPDRDARRRMLGHWLSGAPICEGQLDSLADASEGLSGAELRSRAMAQARRAIMGQPDSTPRESAAARTRTVKENVAAAQGILSLLDAQGRP